MPTELIANTVITNSQRQSIIDQTAKQSEQYDGQLFKLHRDTTGTGTNYKMSPPGTGENGYSKTSYTFNIADEFLWTFSDYREEVPRIQLLEKQLTKNQQLDSLKNKLTNLANNAKNMFSNSDNYVDPYEGLYAGAEPTGFTYVFPYYTTHSYTNTAQWDAKIPEAGNMLGDPVAAGSSLLGSIVGGPIGGLISTIKGDTLEKIAGQYAQVTNNAPFQGIEQPKFFTGPSVQSFHIKFPLFNTGDLASLRMNYDFVRVIAYQNLHDRISLTLYRPPVIYECESQPGYVSPIGHKPALYMSKLDITNVGAIRSINIGGNAGRITIPEAYVVDIVLTELVATSRQIYSSVFTNKSVVTTARPADSEYDGPPAPNPSNVAGSTSSPTPGATSGTSSNANARGGSINNNAPNYVPPNQQSAIQDFPGGPFPQGKLRYSYISTSGRNKTQ